MSEPIIYLFCLFREVRFTAIIFFFGILLVHQQDKVLSPGVCTVLFGSAVCLLFSKYTRLLAVLFFSIAWGNWHGHQYLNAYIDDRLYEQEIFVRGQIISIPKLGPDATRFIFQIDDIEHPFVSAPVRANVTLAWYGRIPELKAGDRWALTVKLKKKKGLRNPGGFDLEGYHYQQRIVASGYVKNQQAVLLAHSAHQFHSLRQQLYDRLADRFESHELLGLLLALAMAERQAMGDVHWSVLTQTGTNHLMAISGLHIGIIATCGFFLGRRLWSMSSRAVMWMPAQRFAAFSAIGFALFYAALAGMTVPTQRALVMVTVTMLCLLSARKIAISQILAIALLAVLLYDPSSVLDTGFYLSFIAVMWVVYALKCTENRSRYSRWFWVQMIVVTGLMPFTVYYFYSVQWLSPIANMVAIPWVSMITVPLILAGSILLMLVPFIGAGLIQLALWSLEIIWWFLARLSQCPWDIYVVGHKSLGVVLMAAIGALWLWAPKGFPARYIGALILVVALWPSMQKLRYSEARVTVLDVGQGLAVVVETRNHVLVYDTGAMAHVVAPFLRRQGHQSIDLLVLSHGDDDHAGGYPSLDRAFEIDEVYTGEPVRVGGDVKACYRGQNWTWDGVGFEVLHPDAPWLELGNNSSCVLKLTTADGVVLLPGDIESLAESRLARIEAGGLAADILLAPHHGSNTSSTEVFIKQVQPKYVIFSSAYNNRYGFPHERVSARYAQRQVRMMNTAESGAIQFHLGKQDWFQQIWLYSDQRRKFWHRF